MRTRLDLPIPFTLPFFSKSAASDKGNQPASGLVAMEPAHHTNLQPPWDSGADKPLIQTRVWSDEEKASQYGRNHHRCDDAGTDSRCSMHSVQGVMVETALTRESHQTGQH